ncbi:hypothetical protein O1157_18660 [Streptomyces albogriseolus]
MEHEVFVPVEAERLREVLDDPRGSPGRCPGSSTTPVRIPSPGV